MTTPRFDIPSYDAAMSRVIRAVAQALVEQDPILRDIPTRSTEHAGPNRNVRRPDVLDQPLGRIRYGMSIPFDVIRAADVEAFITLLIEAAEEHRAKLAAHLFSSIAAVTKATGNEIAADGRPLSLDLICDLIERME